MYLCMMYGSHGCIKVSLSKNYLYKSILGFWGALLSSPCDVLFDVHARVDLLFAPFSRESPREFLSVSIWYCWNAAQPDT